MASEWRTDQLLLLGCDRNSPVIAKEYEGKSYYLST
jgi:hypothetical protein